MSEKQKVIIIGAGVGGIATAIYLAQKGYEVSIFEKNTFAGGRCSSLIKDGHRFDIGATLLMMPEVYKRMYNDFGKKMEEELELFRMDPIYRIKYHNDKEVLFSSDLAKLQQQFEEIEKGSYQQFLAYMNESYKSYELSMKSVIDRNYYSIFEFFNIKNLLLLKKTKAFNNHYKRASKFFKSEELRIAFTFQNIYVGQNPFEASAIFAMLPFLELTDGVWFPKGGMKQVVDSLLKIAREHDVEIHYKADVKSIETANKKASGIILKDGSFHTANIVIANADLPYVYQELLPESSYIKKLNKLKYTCSALVFHWGINTNIQGVEQHNVFVSGDYKANIEGVFKGKNEKYEPSFYLHSPVKTDITAAPEGQDSISVIVPVDNIHEGVDYNWDEIRSFSRKSVFDRLAKEGIPDFEKHIKFEKVYTPVSWESVYNLSRGAIFGSLSHDIMQMGYFRPHNQHANYKNLFFVGGSTHPGNGVPMVLISARLTAEKVMKNFG